MSWRLAKSLDVLRAQINAAYPNRSKASDGTIGNAEHASRSSDHNPWVRDGSTGIVTALDVTHDPAHGLDSERLAEALLASKDSRIKYVISNRKIANRMPTGGKAAWAWRSYTGKNPHDHHVHISVREVKDFYDDGRSWPISLPEAIETPTAVLSVVESQTPVLRKGDSGVNVERLQGLLKKHGAKLAVDGDFGPVTEKAVRAFQKKHKLVTDGRVGFYTWKALEI